MLKNTIDRAIALVSHPFVETALLLAVRLTMARIFWLSARTKVEQDSLLSISDTTTFLFAEEYGMPFPAITGTIATYAEHLFAILLVLGLATRFGAAGILVMTLIIQFFVYPDAWWQVHVFWVLLTLVLIVRGGGALSLDRLFGSRFSAT